MMTIKYSDNTGNKSDAGEIQGSGMKKIGIIAVILVLALGAALFLMGKIGNNSVCGDDVCDAGENCLNCKKDCGCIGGTECNSNTAECSSIAKTVSSADLCKTTRNCWDNPTVCPCASDEYCSKDTKQCVKPDCGNGVCEIYESMQNCCLDCGCLLPGSVCNEDTKKCEDQVMILSDEAALSIAKEYYENQGVDASGAKIGRVSAYNDILIKVVNVPVTGGAVDYTLSVGITENGDVIDLPKA